MAVQPTHFSKIVGRFLSNERQPHRSESLLPCNTDFKLVSIVIWELVFLSKQAAAAHPKDGILKSIALDADTFTPGEFENRIAAKEYMRDRSKIRLRKEIVNLEGYDLRRITK